jgi:hypothetical protein
MAKRRTSQAIVRAVPMMRAPSQIIQVRSPAAPRAAKKKHHRRKGGAAGALNQSTMTSHAVGGFAYGMIEKYAGASIPTLPLVGRAGAIAIGAYMFAKGRGGIVADVARAAAVIAGYQLGAQGKISGIPNQVHGIAAQV